MFTPTNTEENSASVLMPGPNSKMPWRVARVEAVGDLALRVWFLDGLSGTIRFERTWMNGVFEALKDPVLFKKVYVEYGAVTWPGELDLAPDAMYDEIKKNGEWVLR
jgi:hypothetical protein